MTGGPPMSWLDRILRLLRLGSARRPPRPDRYEPAKHYMRGGGPKQTAETRPEATIAADRPG